VASFLDRMKAKMTGSFGKGAPRPKPEQVRKSRNTIRTNRWDERVWEEARKSGPIDDFVHDLITGDEIKGGSREAFEMAPETVHDLFMALYKADPQLEHKRMVDRSAYPVRKIMEELLESPQLQELQDITNGDPVMSTIGTSTMRDAVMEIVTRLPPPPPPPGQGQGKGGGGKGQGEQQGGGGGQGQPGDGQGEGQQGAGQGNKNSGKPEHQKQDPNDQQDDEEQQDEPEEQDDSEGDGDGEKDNGEGGDAEWDPDAEEDEGEADWEAMYDNLLEDMDLGMDLDAALSDAKDAIEELNDLRKGVGIDDGTWATMSPEQRFKIAERLKSPEMRTLADVIGRMRRFALGTRATRLIDVPHEAFDVEQGDKIQRLLKGQFALLGHPDTEMEFYRRLADGELLQFKMRGTEDAGKGPIVIAIDKSGSMQGTPFNWAMGVAEALRRFAADDERDYHAMFFGNNNDRNHFDFPKGKGPWEKIEAFLSVVANGGTQFDGVLTEALQKAQTAFDGDAKGKADIVFVTDGQAHLTDEWIDSFNAEKARVGVRVFSVYIGGAYDYYGEGANTLLSRFSDAVITVKDLNPESAQKIFASI
jgi:uncharacterized protein with von Willebrand factor type A (vWA) domain